MKEEQPASRRQQSVNGAEETWIALDSPDRYQIQITGTTLVGDGLEPLVDDGGIGQAENADGFAEEGGLPRLDRSSSIWREVEQFSTEWRGSRRRNRHRTSCRQELPTCRAATSGSINNRSNVSSVGRRKGEGSQVDRCIPELASS